MVEFTRSKKESAQRGVTNAVNVEEESRCSKMQEIWKARKQHLIDRYPLILSRRAASKLFSVMPAKRAEMLPSYRISETSGAR